MTRTITLRTEADLERFLTTYDPVNGPVRSTPVRRILAWQAGIGADRAALVARFRAEQSGRAEDFERAADLFDAAGYTAGAVLRQIAAKRRAREPARLRVTPDGIYHVVS